MIFDSEQWEWQKADQEAVIGGLLNVVSGQLGGVYLESYAVVPADFYRYFAEVHPDRDIAYVTFYVEEKNGGYTFGYSINNDEYPLWRYARLPVWIDDSYGYGGY